MTTESASRRQEQWVLCVRRSFGISDLAADEEAREALIENLEGQLRGNGWRSSNHGVAEPMVDALLALWASEHLDERLVPRSDAAYRLLDRGTSVVDPEHLVFDVTSEYPPEVVAVAQRVVDQVGDYAREQPLRD